MQVVVFGGTTEGRRMVSWLAKQPGCQVTACCATGYGASLVESAPNVEVLDCRLDQAGMEKLLVDTGAQVVVDATHPYAAVVTQNAHAAAEAQGIPYVRVLREDEPEEGPWVSVPDVPAAAEYVANHPGNVLLATGSKDLATFTSAVPDFAQRLFARILPVESSLAHAVELGVPTSHIIAMQGPFSYELNCALIHTTQAAIMVTKASGATGGFEEKVRAACDCGCQLVVISRPLQLEGFDFDGACAALSGMLEGK